MKKSFNYTLHELLIRSWERISYVPLDAIDRMNGRGSMIPPRSMIFTGGGDFEKIGLEFKGYFTDLAGLQPSDKVLDVGCGLGRMAVPLTNYLSESGEYWGFDIVRRGIEWCEGHISRSYPNFHFQHSNVYNQHYNPEGRVRAHDFRFPFEDGCFDFVFLTSVLTHMLPIDVENYLSEISRVLKLGGNCLTTFFLLNDESERLIQCGLSTLDFSQEIQGCLTTDIDDPEIALAYREAWVLDLLERHALRMKEPVHYGSWCGRDVSLSYQDVIIATKVGSER